MPSSVNEIIASAQRVLERVWRTPARLGDVKALSRVGARNLVLRCAVVAGPGQAPAAVVVKQACGKDFNPNDPASRSALGLFRDWAGLQFLGSLGQSDLAPVFYGGDRQAGLFVMEDLSGAPDLDSVLMCGHRQQAEESLGTLARTLGRMHARTCGRAAEYQQIRDALSPGDPNSRLGPAKHVRDSAAKLLETLQRLGIAAGAPFVADLLLVAQAIEDPGPFLAYTHGDPCPDNCRIAGGRLRLIDFEFGGFRHALLDGIYGRLRFPTCWNVRDIPEAVIACMDEDYRAELVRGCPVAADDNAYQRGLAAAAAFWTVENLEHLLGRALQYEQPMGLATNRQRLLTRLAALETVAPAGYLESFFDGIRLLHEKLRCRWDGAMPVYDAFRQERELSAQSVLEFLEAVKTAEIPRVQQLLANNPSLANAKVPGGDQEPAIYLAVQTHSPDLARELLANGADWRLTTRSGWTTLAKACAAGTPEVVDLLLQHGADLNVRDTWGSLPIYGALGNPEMVEFLTARGAVIDLKAALDLKRLDLARKLLAEDPARARFRFGTGLTLLHDAARVADTDVAAMRLLLEHGADINARTNWEATPLHIAAFNGRAAAVEFLLNQGADPTARDQHGRTPLALALAKGHTAAAQALRGLADPEQ